MFLLCIIIKKNENNPFDYTIFAVKFIDMKKAYIIIALFAFCFVGCQSKKSAKISVSIKGYEKNTPIVVHISDGIGSITFWEPDTIYANKRGNFDFKIAVKDPQMIIIHPLQSNGNYISRPILITKAGKYNISLNIKDAKNPTLDPLFEGDNENGVNQIFQFDNYYQNQERNNTIFKSLTPEELWNKLHEKIQIEMNPFDNFLKNRSIDKTFYEYASHYINYYFAYQSVIFINQQPSSSDTSRSKEWINIKTNIFKTFPISDQNILISRVGKEYVDLYISEIIQQNKAEYDEALKLSLGQTFVIHKIKKMLHPNTYKYYALQYIDSKTMRLDRETITLFERYAQEHPDCSKSPIFQKILRESIPAIKAFYAAGNNSLQSEIAILDEELPISSFKEITQKFQGQYIFIDIWASWCPDCISEFQYNETLKKFLKEKNIPIVYIAFERSPDRDKWKLYLNKYMLTGNHIKCSDSLKEDLYRILGSRSIWIPRYILVDPTGTIVISDAFTPSSGKKLYEQINAKIKRVEIDQPLSK